MGTKIIFALSIITLISCRSNKADNNHETNLQDSNVVTYVDSIKAASAIVDADIDGFFDQISIIDMCIQMKTQKEYKSRSIALSDYKNMLRHEVMNWDPTEKIMLNEIFDTIKNKIYRINPKLLPETIKLVKIRTNHYGPDVYYTRGNHIMIPENALSRENAIEMLEPVMIHEVFHLISRYDISLRENLYSLIGFFPHKKNLIIPETITERWLTNPDGTSTDYYISLSDDVETAKAIPLILSNKSNYSNQNPTFFSYLQFDLFEIDDSGDQAIVKHGENLSTTLTDGMMPGFFEQIRDNTQYIIHPDEIIADNFIFALNESEESLKAKFSDEGAALVRSIKTRLRDY